MNDYTNHYKNLDSLFATFLAQPISALSESERSEIREYVDVGEYGLALSTAVAIFDEEQKIATVEERALIRLLAVTMSKDPKPLLERLAVDDLDQRPSRPPEEV